MSSLEGLRDKIVAKLKDASEKISPDDVERNIAEALTRYSKHRPKISVADITGNGTHDYTLPTTWEDEFSAVQSIEYPIGDVPATLLDNDEYEIYQNTTVKVIRLLNDAPPATASFRVAFTIRRTDSTIPANDEDALCNLAAALCLEDLANGLIHSIDTTIAADSVDYKDKAYKAGQRAKRLMQLYKEHIGIKDEDVTPAASSIKDFDMKYPGGAERLTHKREYRRKR